MSRVSLIISAFVLCCGFAASVFVTPIPYDLNTPVSSVLMALGDDVPEHYIGTFDSEKLGLGKDIVMLGSARLEDGTQTKRISEYFSCVDCHNVLPEAPHAADNDPESRLSYAIEFNQPYLPGSTLYGITNRTSWFNGDHEKKYGADLVGPARHDLRKAIQLCSKECSVGRELEEWEMEGVLHFLNGIELKMRDLQLSDEELEMINTVGQSEEEKVANVKLIKSKYLHAYPATFVDEKPAKERTKGKEGNVQRGKYIFDKSCQHCHAEGKVTKTVFGNKADQKDAAWLVKYFKKSNGGSIYWITRHGTSSKEKTPQYMPIYSKEKLSDSQIEDLAAYLLEESKR